MWLLPSLIALSLTLTLSRVCVSHIELRPGKLDVDDMSVLYQLPSQSHVAGVIFLAHGCSHSATDWWPSSPACSDCLGLPVEMHLVRESLSRAFAVLALSSADRRSKCWGASDAPRAALALRHFYSAVLRSNLSVPLHLLGVSSGGYFMGHLPLKAQLSPPPSSLCLQVSALTLPQGQGPEDLPPVLFIAMERDETLLKRVRQQANELGAGRGAVRVAEPRPLAPLFLSEESHGLIPPDISKRISSALLEKGLLNKETQLLLRDPRHSSWREVVKEAAGDWLVGRDSLVADQSSISELLNVAWGGHEIVGEFAKDTLDFFAQHGAIAPSS